MQNRVFNKITSVGDCDASFPTVELPLGTAPTKQFPMCHTILPNKTTTVSIPSSAVLPALSQEVYTTLSLSTSRAPKKLACEYSAIF